MGRVRYDELHRYSPAARLAAKEVPTLFVYGTADGIVPYDPTRDAAERAGAEFHTVE